MSDVIRPQNPPFYPITEMLGMQILNVYYVNCSVWIYCAIYLKVRYASVHHWLCYTILFMCIIIINEIVYIKVPRNYEEAIPMGQKRPKCGRSNLSIWTFGFNNFFRDMASVVLSQGCPGTEHGSLPSTACFESLAPVEAVSVINTMLWFCRH